MAKGVTMKQTNVDLSRTPGWRENREVIDAAIAQGWTYRPSKGGSHLRLTPPDPDKDSVTIGGTPSDFRSRRNTISQMKQNGLIWPWPPKPVKTNGDPEPVIEQWAPIMECSVAEVSNGGNVRKAIGHKPIEVDHKRKVTLTDDKGNVRTFSVPLLVRALFGHAPLPHVVPAPEAIKEADMVAQAETPVTERWEPVLIEGVPEGYEVNAAAKVLPPKNEKFKDRKPLVPTVRHGRLVVNLKQTHKTGYRQYPLDEIVLEAFEARPSINHYPKHCDNDPNNCTLDNLVWAEYERTKGEAIREHEARLSDKLTSDVQKIAGASKPNTGLVLADLDLPGRTYGMLKRKGITTVEELVSKTERDLWGLGLTSVSIDAIKTKLSGRGLSLASAESADDEIVTTPVVTKKDAPREIETFERPDTVAVDPPITEEQVEDEAPQETPVVAVEPVVEEKDPARERWEAEQYAKGMVYPMGKLSEVVIKRVTTYTNPVTGLSVTVDEDGQSSLPEGRLTPGQITALSHILMAITEDNDKLGERQ